MCRWCLSSQEFFGGIKASFSVGREIANGMPNLIELGVGRSAICGVVEEQVASIVVEAWPKWM